MFTVTGYGQDRYKQQLMTQDELSDLKEAEITYSTVWWNTVCDRHVTVNTSLNDNRDVIKRTQKIIWKQWIHNRCKNYRKGDRNKHLCVRDCTDEKKVEDVCFSLFMTSNEIGNTTPTRYPSASPQALLRFKNDPTEYTMFNPFQVRYIPRKWTGRTSFKYILHKEFCKLLAVRVHGLP